MIFYQIHELIMQDHRISAKSIAEQLDISSERVESINNENLDIRKLSAKRVAKCLNTDEKRQRLSKFWIFLRDENGFLSRLVTMEETWW